jgi:hypothetical protein
MIAAIAIGPPEIVVMSVLGAVFLIALLGMGWGFLQARRSRELEHAERMKAIEMGRPWPPEKVEATAAALAENAPEHLPATLVKTVPLSSLGIALGASVVMRPEPVFWVAAGAVGVTSLICGTVISLHQGPARGQAMRTAKPVSDPDALDVVGR